MIRAVLVDARSSSGHYMLPVLVRSLTSTGSHQPLPRPAKDRRYERLSWSQIS